MKPSDLVNYLVDRVRVLFGLEQFSDIIRNTAIKEYRKGIEKVEEELDLNVLIDPENENSLADLSVGLIKDFDEEMTTKLKKELQIAIASGDSNAMIKKKLIGFFSSKPNTSKFNWNDRLNTILRTERSRAENKGKLDAAVNSEIPGLRKYLSVVMDDRTSEICRAEHRKYGSPEQSIPMDKPFVVTVGNKTYTAMSPPFHQNCRSEIMIDTSRVKRE